MCLSFIQIVTSSIAYLREFIENVYNKMEINISIMTVEDIHKNGRCSLEEITYYFQ